MTTTSLRRYTLYRFWDSANRLLYIGITGNAHTRWRDHDRQKLWWREVFRITVEHFDNWDDLEAAEATAIVAEQPLYNVTHNKGRPYVKKAPVRHTCVPREDGGSSPRTLTLIYQSPCKNPTASTEAATPPAPTCRWGCVDGMRIGRNSDVSPCTCALGRAFAKRRACPAKCVNGWVVTGSGGGYPCRRCGSGER